MRRTKIVCTIGPASEKRLPEMIEAGMNVARLNFSHGDYEEHGARIRDIREASKASGKVVTVLLDTKGPEIRTHTFEDGKALLEKGKEVTIVSSEEIVGTKDRFSVTYEGLYEDVEVGSHIMLDDGLIGLRVVEKLPNRDLRCVIENEGIIKTKKGVNLPNVKVNLPALTDKDISDIEFGISQDIDVIAASFVRRASDVVEIRQLLEKHDAAHIKIYPKIENQEGVDNIEEIWAISDGLMVARGDLGIEIPTEEVTPVQKELIKKCNDLGKPVITATQMLDSMQRNPRPTRAEASDVANAILDGTDAVMLSGETAAGDYPVESVQMQAAIAERTERMLDYKNLLKDRQKRSEHTVTDAISQAVAHTAINLNAKAILTPTQSGYTAARTAKYRPEANIIAVTESERVARQLNLVWGVYPIVAETMPNNTDEMLVQASEAARHAGFVTDGDLVVISAGIPAATAGTTNMMKVHIVGHALADGRGIGERGVVGEVVVAKNAEEANAKAKDGMILVAPFTDKEMMPAIEKAAGIITEDGGLTSHAGIVGPSLRKPVIVGVETATSSLRDGQMISIDPLTGKIYNA